MPVRAFLFLETIVNTETGQIYRGDTAIGAARARGEPVVEVSERVATAVEAGMNRAARRARQFGLPPRGPKRRPRQHKPAGRL
jgi:hypothetical protein